MKSEHRIQYYESHKVNLQPQKYHELLFLFCGVALIALHFKGDIGGILGFLILPFLYLSRYEYKIDSKIYNIFFMLVLYLLIFTITSAHPKFSIKADVEILRSFALFFVGWLFCKRLENTRLVWLISLILFATVFCNFFFIKKFGYLQGVEQEFFSYHNDPNRSAFMYAFYLMIAAILFLCSKHWLEKLVNLWTIFLCFCFVFFTNSRSVWLALAVSAFFYAWFSIKVANPVRYVLISSVSVGCVLIVLFFNVKGFSLSYRDIIWKGLVEATLWNNPYFGSGINTIETLLRTISLGSIAVFAHNSIVEVFSSSGVVGLILFSVIVLSLINSFFSTDVNSNSFYMVGLCGLICFSIISLFDFEFFTFRFFSTIWVFVGFCYYGKSIQIKA